MKTKQLLLILLALLGSTTLRAYDALVDGIYYNFSGNEAEVTYKNKIVDDEGSEFIVSDYSGSVNIPSSIIWNGETYTVTSIGNLAFSCCSDLTSVTIPNSVRTIGWLSFSMCSGLSSVYIGNSVTTIQDQAFSGCSSLSSITIPDNVTYIATNALDGTAWYNNQPGGLVYAGKVAYKYKWSVPAGTEIVIRDGTIAIADFFLSDDYHSCDGLTSVTIPNSVISIGWSAFYNCRGLTSINIPNSVTSIGGFAISGCISLTSVVSEIEEPFAFGNGAFGNISSNCVLTVPYGTRDAYIAAGWTEEVFKGGIVEAASPSPNIIFADANVKAICVANWDTNGDGELSEAEATAVTSLGEVFRENTTITSFNELQYFTGLTSISYDAFNKCSNLTSIIIPNGVTYIGDRAFSECSSLTSVAIPNSVESINWYAFNQCSSLISITIPESVTYIGNGVFQSCSSLTSVSIPNGVERIKENTFSNCSSLTSITIPNSVLNIEKWAFYKCNNLISIDIPNSVKNISEEAFRDCISLTSVIIPNSIKEINNLSFSGCSGLTSVSIPNSVTIIGAQAFEYCSSLTSITIPNSVYLIGSSAFSGCSGLTSVSIPNSMKSLMSNAFWGCSSLTDVYCYAEDVPSADGAFPTSVAESATLHVPAASLEAYSTTAPWSGFGTIVAIEEPSPVIAFADANVKAICVANWDTNHDGELSEEEAAAVTDLGEVFRENSTITTFNELQYFTGLIRISDKAFYRCSGLTSVTIPEGVTSIGAQAFNQCTALSSVTIPESVTDMGSWAFCDCPSLTSITIPEGVINIRDNVFRNCTSLTSVSLPESLKTLAGHAFLGCRSLASITIPDGITFLDRIAFQECPNLTTFTYNKAENALTKVNGVYQIGTAEDLCNFAILSTAANTDICAQLTADIDYTGYTIPGGNVGEHFQHIGLNGYRGTFDGNGHTITVNINNPDSWQVAVLFRELGRGGVIKNLRVAGHVESVSKFSAGIVSNLKSGKVSHCVSDVDIISHIDGDCTDGGIAGIATYDGEESIVEYCVVAGSFQGSNAHHRGGIIGIGYGGNSDNITIDNCLFLANVDGLDVTESGTFIRQPTNKTTINNCYYLNVLGSVTSGTQTTTDQLTSGELCFLLNGDQSNIDWTQNLTGTDVDTYPLPFSTHAQVYAYGNTYSNNDLSPIVTFADQAVKAICVANWDTNHDGELSEAEAAAVTDLGTVFKYNTTITSFNELQYFTGLTSIGDYAFYNCSNLTFVTMPESAISIGNFSFHGCNNLSSFIIPEGVAILGENSFEECFSLPSITIPRTVTSIGRNAFTSTNFDSIVVDEGNTVYDSRDNCNAIVETESNTLISGCENTIIPIGVTSIGTEAFSGRSGLTTITIPNSVSSIDYCAFWGTGLTDVFCYANDVPSADYAFDNSSISTATLHVPAGSLKAYCMTAPWSEFGTIVPIDGFVIDDETTSLDVVTEESGKAVIFTHDFNGEWEALYLPFAIDYDNIKDDFDLAEIDGVVQNDQNNDGTPDITVLSIIGFKGQQTTPNKPYLIRAKNAGEQTIVFDNVTVYPTTAASIDCSSTSTKYEFTGSYNTLNASALANRYVVQGGELVKGASSLAPCRWYMTATARNGAPLNLPNRIRIMSVEDVITGVEDLNVDLNLNDSWFDLQGRKVTNPRKGIYIQNGKKVALK